MNYTFQEPERRELCHQRDKEFLALYNPTLDALLEQGMSPSKARRAAAEFTIANGRPHYHVGHERAYRCVCHLLSAADKKGNGARSFRNHEGMGLVKRRLRQQMWFEITGHVLELTRQGMSVPRLALLHHPGHRPDQNLPYPAHPHLPATNHLEKPDLRLKT